MTKGKQMARKKRSRPRGRPKGSTRAKVDGQFSLADIKAVRNFVKQLGKDRAEKLIAALG